MFKNYELLKILELRLKKSKFVKYRNKISVKDFEKFGYDLILNCDFNHEITKKFFSKKFEKNYNCTAYTTIIDHEKLSFNRTANQIFTSEGPLAFLPISANQTSIVYSYTGTKHLEKSDVYILLEKFNKFYKIKSIDNILEFDLRSFNLRKYYKDNILAFGDLLHKIHPLAGQGFNMSIRDIKHLIKIIDERVSIGLPVDKTVCKEFENKTKSTNFLFSEGIDFIYSYFNFENRIKTNFLSSTVKLVGKNRKLNEYFRNFADKGIAI